METTFAAAAAPRIHATDREGVRFISGVGAAWLDRALRAQLLQVLDDAMRADDVVAVVIETAGLGRDSGVEDGALQPDARTLADAVAGAAKPVVAAIAGRCEGSVFELALAAHCRVASGRAKVGLPAIRLGLVPRAGGTQRLPRLVGLEEAVDMLLSGASRAPAALEPAVLFDAVVDESEAAEAARVALAMRAQGRAVDAQAPVDPQREAFMQFCRTTVAARKDAGPAGAQCVELVAASATVPLERALELEARAFDALLASAHSKALRHIDAAQRRVMARADAAPLARSVGWVAVVGAGTMGTGIAMAFAAAGIPVMLMDADPAGLERGLQAITRNWTASVARGKLTQEQVDARLALIREAHRYEDLAEADLFIEAVFERLDVKERVLRSIDAVAREGAVIASNTSALDLDALAGFTRRPADVVGTHFFSPAHVMKLLEVVRGRETSDSTVSTVLALARRIGKLPVVVGVCDGFAGNRMLARYVAAADVLVRQGASPEQVDAALERFGFAMGPFRMGDLAGLDVAQAGRRRRAAANPGRDYTQVADALIEAGRLGQKTRAGWYRYEEGSRTARPDPAVAAIVRQWREAHGIQARRFDDREIVERCVFALANEGARVLQEGIAANAEEIDVIYVNGYGFPPWRGGPMHHAAQAGFAQVVRALHAFAREPGADASWQPAPLLARLADEGAAGWEPVARAAA